MNLDTMNEVQRRGGRFWNVSTVAELFDSPLPKNDPNGNDIEDWQDLFRTGVLGEIFVPESDEVFSVFRTARKKIAFQLWSSLPGKSIMLVRNLSTTLLTRLMVNQSCKKFTQKRAKISQNNGRR